MLSKGSVKFAAKEIAQITEASLTALHCFEKTNCCFSGDVAKEEKKKRLFLVGLILSDAEHTFTCMVLSACTSTDVNMKLILMRRLGCW